MRRVLILGALLAVAGSAVAAGAIKWKSSYEMAVAEAKSTHRLVMVDFYTDWCTWCKRLDADTYPAPAVEKEAESFVPVKVNAEKEGVAAAKKYDVEGYPTVVFLQPDGTLVWKISGYLPAEDFAKQMHLASSVTTEVPALETKLKANPTDATVAAQLVPYYSGMAKLDKIPAVVKVIDQGTAAPAVKADAYNAAGDAFQNANKNDDAVPYFEKAIQQNLPHQAAYARMSIAQCYLTSGQAAKAKPYLQALADMGSIAGDYGTEAKKLLDQMKS